MGRFLWLINALKKYFNETKSTVLKSKPVKKVKNLVNAVRVSNTMNNATPNFNYPWMLSDENVARLLGFVPSANISMAEKLGLPKGDRGNLNRFQKEALSDVELYLNSGLYRLTPTYENGTITYGSGLNNVTRTLAEQGVPLKGYDNYATFRNVLLDNGTTVSFRPSDNTVTMVSAHNLLSPNPFTKFAFGDLTLGASKDGTGNLIMTSPRADLLSLDQDIIDMVGNNIELIPTTINKDAVKEFWKTVFNTRKPGSYFSGDAGNLPLGHRLISDYKAIGKPIYHTNNNGVKTLVGREGWQTLINDLFRPTVYHARPDGLSVDSYMALLKLGNRPGYQLRFSPDGLQNFNAQGVENKWIYDLHLKALNGEIPQQEFVDAFNLWVKPYNGMEAKIIKDYKGNNIISIPQPYVYKEKKGGSIHIKKKNRGKFTASAKRAGEGVEEHAHKVVNDPNATTLQKRRAQFAINAKKWSKH